MFRETMGEGLYEGIGPSGVHCGDVEGTADGFPAAADGSFAFHGAAVSIEGSQTHERGDLLTIELADLGNVGDDGGGSDTAQTGNRFDELGFVAPLVVGLQERLNDLLDAADFGFGGVDHG